MASKLHFVIASTFVIALLQHTQAAVDQCTTTSYGNLHGSLVLQLPRSYLDSSSRDWTVTITKPSSCYVENGVFGKACDTQQAPAAYFQDINHLNVHRNADMSEQATVDITVYCN